MSSSRKKSGSSPSKVILPSKTASLSDELNAMHAAILARAHEIFCAHDQLFDCALDDWLAAERQLAWRPRIDLIENDGEFSLTVDVAGVRPEDLDLQVTADSILLKTLQKDEQEPESAPGVVHIGELAPAANLFCVVDLPSPIDQDSVMAECHDGLLRVRARIREAAEPRHIAVAAA